jgi:hypothetical protein
MKRKQLHNGKQIGGRGVSTSHADYERWQRNRQREKSMAG